MLGYIYRVTNNINGKIYVGKHNGKVFDKNYYGSGVKIIRAIKKYSKENFTVDVLDWYDSLDDCIAKERYYIKKLDSRNFETGYNISEGGQWGDCTSSMTPEEYQAWRDKMIISHTGNTKGWTPERRLATSERYSGDGNPMYGKSGTNLGKKFDKEWKSNISDSLTGVATGSRSRTMITLYINDEAVMCFRGKSNMERYCRKIGIPRQLFLDSCKNGVEIGSLSYHTGANQYSIDRDKKQNMFAKYKLIQEKIPR